MYKLIEQLNTANKAGTETLATIANTAFGGAECLAALNLNTARSLLENSIANARALLGVKDMQGLILLQSTVARPNLQQAASYSRRVCEIATQTREVLSHVAEGQVSDLNNSVGLALDKAVRAAPAGSDLAVNAIRSAFSSANSAYDGMTKAARQAAAITEAAVAAVTTVALESVKKAA